MRPKTISERVEVPGARPAAFKLVEKAEESFDLFRSSRRIGTARVEPDGTWTATFAAPQGRWIADADSAAALLQLVGTYLLAGEARDDAGKPIEATHPELRVKGKKTAEERISTEFVRRAQARRIADLDEEIGQLREHIRKAPKR